MRTTLVSVIVLALAVAGAAVAGSGAAPGTILAALNSQRTANGIPGRVRENAAWSEKCAKHIAYMGTTGTFAHSEDPSSPAYTADGNWAGENSVLAQGSSWPTGDPFASAPIHLIQLLSPELRQVGIEASSGFVCVTTWPGYTAAGWKTPKVFTVPGNGTGGVPVAETADELPFVPGDVVGLPRGTTTGFNIMVFAEGVRDPWHLRITAASLTGPHGPVTVRTVDRTTATVGPYLPSGSGFIIPVAPLEAGATYTASVRFAGGEARRTWHFTTATAKG